MKLGGKCPLDVRDRERFIRAEIERFYKKPVSMSAEKLREEFCSKVCKNILC